MKTKVALRRAKWLQYCLSIGYPKEALPQLEEVWDKFKDENGNMKALTPGVEAGILTTDEGEWELVYDDAQTNHTLEFIGNMKRRYILIRRDQTHEPTK